MDAAAIAALITAVSNVITVAAPLVIQAEQNAKPFAQAIVNMFKGTNLTDDDINALIAKANALSAQIQDPNFIAPAQPDDV